MRPVRDDDRPIFGSVWSWEETGRKMMAIAPDPSVASNYRWWFVVVEAPREIVKMYWGFNGVPSEGWWKHD